MQLELYSANMASYTRPLRSMLLDCVLALNSVEKQFEIKCLLRNYLGLFQEEISKNVEI